MVFHWILNDNKSTLLSILANLNSAVVWMVSTHSLISKSSSLFTTPLVTVPRPPVIIGTTVTFMFHSLSFFPFPSKVQVLILLFAFFQFYSMVNRDSKGHNSASSLVFFVFFWGGGVIIRSGRLAKFRWSVCISKSQRGLCISFSRTDSELCIYHFFTW